MKDFTTGMYVQLLDALKAEGYQFQTIQSYFQAPLAKVVLIRHDIDLRAKSALQFARLENEHGIQATYYFRITKGSFNPTIIKEVARLGHEIGYHYEDLSLSNGDVFEAIQNFEKHLNDFRKLYPIKTVCMHGSSGSQHDNRDLWITNSLSDYGLIAEPYVSIDFNKVLYLTDTSQRWNGSKIALRDKVKSSFDFDFRTTGDVIKDIDKLPNQLMFTIHPELWASSFPQWLFVKIFFSAHTFYKVHYRNKKVLKQQKRERISNNGS